MKRMYLIQGRPGRYANDEAQLRELWVRIGRLAVRIDIAVEMLTE